MPIKLITGLPGSGKSLSAVELLYNEARKAERRPIFAVGIDGLVDGLAEPLDDPRKWQSLPDGSLVVVDEAQKWFPTRRTDAPDYVSALSEHRHRGFDFVLVTQHPAMIDSYVRRLVSEHTHVVRRFGSGVATRYRWGEVVEDVQSSVARSRGVETIWRYPADLYRLYKSATIHTVKRRLPWQVIALPVVGVLLLITVVFAWRLLDAWGGDESNQVEQTSKRLDGKTDRRLNGDDEKKARSGIFGGNKQSTIVENAKRIQYKDALEYAQMHTPRIPSLPWSAPVFDDRRVQSEPEVYCIIVEGKGCRCYTEQVTRYEMPEGNCRVIAERGVYNPYRRREIVTNQAPSLDRSREDADVPAVERTESVPAAADSVAYGSPSSPAVPGSAWVLGRPRQ